MTKELTIATDASIQRRINAPSDVHFQSITNKKKQQLRGIFFKIQPHKIAIQPQFKLQSSGCWFDYNHSWIINSIKNGWIPKLATEPFPAINSTVGNFIFKLRIPEFFFRNYGWGREFDCISPVVKTKKKKLIKSEKNPKEYWFPRWFIWKPQFYSHFRISIVFFLFQTSFDFKHSLDRFNRILPPFPLPKVASKVKSPSNWPAKLSAMSIYLSIHFCFQINWSSFVKHQRYQLAPHRNRANLLISTRRWKGFVRSGVARVI